MSQSKKKLLAIGHSYVVALNRSVMRELDRKGEYDVTVVAPSFFHGDQRSLALEPEPPGSSLKVIGIDVYFSKSIHLFFYNLWQLKKILNDGGFDKAYLWEEAYILSGYQLSREFSQRKIPFCFYSCQNLQKEYPFPFSYFENSVFLKSQALAGCGVLVESVHREKGFLKKNEVLPFFVDLERFLPIPRELKKERQNQKKLKGFVIGFMGRWTEEKGCRIFMQAINSLPPEINWSCLILGQGPMKSDFLKWIEDKNYQDRVQLHHLKHDEVPEWLPLCDVLLCPSQTTTFWKEQFGRMLVEAFALGVPVIASNSGEIPYVVGDAGVIVDERNQEAWNKALLEMMQSSEQQEIYRQRGIVKSLNYSAVSIAQQLASFLNSW